MRSKDRDAIRAYVARLDHERATLASELEEEIAPVRALSIAERGAWVASVCRSAWAVLRSRQDMHEVLAMREAPAPDFEELWKGLMARRKAAQTRTPS
jgi:hypothetical protein